MSTLTGWLRRSSILLGSAWLGFATPASAQEEKSQPTHVATAEVVRADVAAGKLTLRGEDGEIVMDAAAPALQGLRPGDPVIVGYRVQPREQGGDRKVLTALRANPARQAGTAARSDTSARFLRNVRVSHVDASAPALAVQDVRGTVHVLSVREDLAPSLRQLQPGDRVNVSLGRAGSGATDIAVRIDRLGSATAAAVPADASAPLPPPDPVEPAVAQPATGGFPLELTRDTVPSIPAPTPAPQTALPPATVVRAGTPDSVALQRAEQDLEASAAVLARAATTIDRMWSAHRELCIKGALNATTHEREWFRLLDGDLPDPDSDDCRRQRDELSEDTRQFRDQLGSAVRTAQAAGVLPGRVREILDRHRIDL